MHNPCTSVLHTNETFARWGKSDGRAALARVGGHSDSLDPRTTQAARTPADLPPSLATAVVAVDL
jgi:hypothetical protein